MKSGDKLKGIISAVAILALTFLYVVILGDRVPSEPESSIAERRQRANAARLEKLAGNYRVQYENPEIPDLKWTGSTDVAIELSRRSGKLIFLAIDSLNSIYAAENRIGFFGQNSDVRKAMAEYVLLSLFIDSLPNFALKSTANSEWKSEAIELNRSFWIETLNDGMAPNYVVAEPADDGGLKIIGRSPQNGYVIDDKQAFLDFLKNPAK